MNKLVYELGVSLDDSQEDDYDIPHNVNTDLHKILREQKECINDQFWSKKWDRFKKYANDFELIFTSGFGSPSISSYIPISRSFFKLWEILHDFEDVLLIKNDPQGLKAAFLAEGPGGFIEAFATYRGDKFCNDKLYGVTLLSSDRNIPCWKVPPRLMNANNIMLLGGADGTGSLYNNDNINSFVHVIGANSCAFVTADGGFDFSTNFNGQEELSSALISAEINTALQLLQCGGTFILKMFDINTDLSFQLLALLRLNFQRVIISKPLSSRPANSEKYIICISFKGHTTSLTPVNKVPSSLVQDVVYFNALNIIRQSIHINRTFCLIHSSKQDKNDPIFCKTLKFQLANAIRWCNKYNIQINPRAIIAYKSMYFS